MLHKQVNTLTKTASVIFPLSDNHELEALFEISQKQLEAGDFVAEEDVYARLEARISKQLSGKVK
jgi:hypothetical protein